MTTSETIGPEAARRAETMRRIGYGLSGLVVLFLVMDAVMKLLALPVVLETQAQLGYPAGLTRGLGVVLLLCTALYAAPRTAVLGGLLLTGYLGGAAASHLRVASPLFSRTLFGVYVGALVWAGLYLRDARLRALLPLRA